MEVDDEVEARQPSRKLQRFSEQNDGEPLTGMSNNNRIRDWNPSSRIIRVSRASGGKDRHSKVLTSKGLRDRRIRLSVATAIQFYDLQDRLGLDQPSKAVEWLLNAASDSISDLPSINTNFSDERMASNNNGGFRDFNNNLDDQNQNKTLSLSKSACSSTSETSKSSSAAAALSLSRTEIRGKARERARERTAKEREKDIQNAQSSFTQLLTGGFSNIDDQTGSTRQWNGTDYFNPVQLIPSSPHQTHLSNSSLPHIPPFTISNDRQEPMNHHFSFVPDLIHTTATPATDYNLNFGISSSSSPGDRSTIGGYNRGTLQSNSSSFLFNNNIQRFSSSSTSSSSSSSPMDSQSISFFMAPPPLDHHNHQLQGGFDGRLFLYGNRSSENKGKERR